jgi:hypothetical protein
MASKTLGQREEYNLVTIETLTPLNLQELTHQVQVLKNVVLSIQEQFHTLSFPQQEIHYPTPLHAPNA